MAGNLTNMIASIFSGSAVTADPYYEYTTLLLPGSGTNGAQNNTFLDGSTNNFTITRNGNTTQGTFSPFSQTGWGNYFNGTNAYLTSSHPALNATFTIEAWVYRTSGSALQSVVFLNSGGVSGVIVYIDTSNYLVCTDGSTGQPAFSNLTVPINAWAHIAVVRSGGTTTGYVNGTVAGSHTFTPAAVSAATIARYAAANPLYFPGYISNVRVVNGTAVYTGAFTPPSLAPLTNAGATSAASYPSTTNVNTSFASSATSLLTCQSNRFIDNSSSPVTITPNGSPTVVAFSPFNPTSSWSAATYGGSGYFDGSGDYLTWGPGSGAAFGTSAFCVEMWFYPTGSIASIYLIDARNASQTNTWSLATGYSGTQSNIEWGNNGTVIASGGTTNIISNTWNHIVYCRSGTGANQASMFINGVRQANVTDSTNYNVSPTISYVAARYSAANFLTGYLSNIRIVNGSQVYDPSLSTLTVPTAPLTAITNTSLLLNFTNAGIYDATSKNDLETVGDAQISNAITPKWGSTSIKFDGTGDYLTNNNASNSLLAFGTGDFTIECWTYFTSLANKGVFQISTTAGGLQASQTNTLAVNYDSGGAGWGFYAKNTSITGAGTNPLNNWVHIALVRSGTTTTLYVNGTNTILTTSDTTNYTGTYICVGGYYSTSYLFNGYIQDLRITKGYARYTANFTAPTAAFPTL